MHKKNIKGILFILGAAVCLTACAGGADASKKAESQTESQTESPEESQPESPEEKETAGAEEPEESRTDAGAEDGADESGEAEKGKSRGIFEQFEVSDLDGNPVNQEIFADYDLTMINMWATFCGPCIMEMPELASLAEEYQEKGVQIVGLCTDTVEIDGTVIDSQIEEAKRIAEETGAAYLHIVPEGKLAPLLLPQIQAVPTTIFVDKNGKQVGMGVMGARDKEAWAEMIDELLQ